ncbi:DUF2157 domain-containing protein [Aeromonas caviae]|uniref:DUF2157 domain-containing protein n=1 Tax=Aeromonas caviae TaxID=648 RepID=UPI0025B6D781|nr:DUF2157 domain-containing protein [Aeromonas caviae]
MSQISLVGAGPGPLELLTLRALHHLEAAEVVVYDRLVGSEILARIPHGAARFDVGKRCGEPSPTQEEINALLLALALNLGALLALVGQTYQTGADPWQLFATWALMLLPLAALGRSPLLWTLAWLLGQLALVLYWRLGLLDLFFSFNEEALGWCLTLLNAALWGLLILVPARYALMPSWLAGLAAGLGITLLTLLALFDAASPWVWPAWLAWLGAAYLRWHHRFIAGLAMGCLSLIAVILAALGKWMEPDMNGFLLLALIAIGLSVMASRWLQQQRRQHV